MLIYKEPIKVYYSSDIFDNHNIDTKNINEALINYNDGIITQDKFLQIYNVFINDFDKCSKVIKKKQPGARGPNQNARLPILLAQIKAGNNSLELKNEIRQLLYSLYKSKQITKTVYKNLIATI